MITSPRRSQHNHRQQFLPSATPLHTPPPPPPTPPPTQPPRLIAWHVKTMLAKLHAGPLHRTAMRPHRPPLHHRARGELHVVQMLHQLRLEISTDLAHRIPPLN